MGFVFQPNQIEKSANEHRISRQDLNYAIIDINDNFRHNKEDKSTVINISNQSKINKSNKVRLILIH